MIAVLEYLVYPLIALMFVAVFTREVIAPASRNHCDRRWLFYSSALGALTLVCTLALGYVLESRIRQQALLDRVGSFLLQQCRCVSNRRQQIAYLMRDAGSQAPH